MDSCSLGARGAGGCDASFSLFLLGNGGRGRPGGGLVGIGGFHGIWYERLIDIAVKRNRQVRLRNGSDAEEQASASKQASLVTPNS